MDPVLPAVLFDLDGTLVDSEPLYFEAGRQVFAAHGVDFTWERHVEFIGISTRETLTTLRAEYALTPSVEALLVEKNDWYLRLVRRSIRVFPGMRTLVERLHAAGHPLAVASGSSRVAIDLVLEVTGLGALVPVRVSADEVARGKPEPDVFLAAARRLGVAPGDCVVCEDAVPGVEAARRAGMRCLAVPSLAGLADAPGFAAADLLVAGGPEAFDPAAAFAWLTGG